eukprot:4339775-Prymnesium_polylepis.1
MEPGRGLARAHCKEVAAGSAWERRERVSRDVRAPSVLLFISSNAMNTADLELSAQCPARLTPTRTTAGGAAICKPGDDVDAATARATIALASKSAWDLFGAHCVALAYSLRLPFRLWLPPAPGTQADGT